MKGVKSILQLYFVLGRFSAIVFIDDVLIRKFRNFLGPRIHKSVGPKFAKISSSSRIETYFNAFFSDCSRYENDRPLVEVKILEFLLLLSNSCKNNEAFLSALLNPSNRRNIRAFMEDHYLEKLKVKDYAALTGRSLTTFNREFKRLFNNPKKSAY